jgi:hypothetical protein
MSSKSHASSHIDKTHKQEQSVQSQPVETESLPHVVRKVESGRDVVSPQNMLQLQRSVGNRAVVRRMTVPVTQLTPQVRIQRADLDTLYGDRVKENLEKQQYLDDFKKNTDSSKKQAEGFANSSRRAASNESMGRGTGKF